jgi:hypothetical protein
MRTGPRYEQSYRPNFSWAIFLSGLLISGFVGGGIRFIYLSNEQASESIKKALTVAFPDHQIEVKSAQFNLKKFLLPKIAMAVGELKLTPKNLCLNATELKFNNLNLPIGFWRSLSLKKLVIDGILADRVEVNHSPPCKVKVQSSALAVTDNQDKILKGVGQTLKSTELKYVEIDSIQVVYQDKKYNIQNLEVEHSDGEVDYNFLLKANEAFESFSQMTPIRVFGEASKGFANFKASGRLREGTFSASGNFKNNNLEVLTKTYNFPISQMLINETIGSHVQLNKLPLWANCEVRFVKNQEQENIEVNGCVLKSTSAKLSADKILWKKVDGRFVHEPFKVQISHVDIKLIFRLLNKSGLSGVFNDYGFLNAELSVDTRDQWELIYNVTNPRLYFSRAGVPGYQSINYLNGKLSLTEDRVSGIISDINLRGGEFKGSLSFNFDKRFEEGIIQLAIEELTFAPMIQNLMLQGELGKFSIFGKGLIKNGKINNWEGDMALSSFKSSWLEAEDLKFKTIFVNGRLKGQSQAKNIVFAIDPKLKSSWQMSYGVNNFTFNKLESSINSKKDLKILSTQGTLIDNKAEVLPFELIFEPVLRLSLGSSKNKIDLQWDPKELLFIKKKQQP